MEKKFVEWKISCHAMVHHGTEVFMIPTYTSEALGLLLSKGSPAFFMMTNTKQLNCALEWLAFQNVEDVMQL